MEYKNLLQKGGYQIDLKKTQTELLKILKNLKDSGKKEPSTDYDEIYKELNILIDYLNKLDKNNIEVEQSLFIHPDPITQMINYVGPDNVEFKLHENLKIKPILKLKNINIKDDSITDFTNYENIEDKLKDNLDRKINYSFKDLDLELSDELLKESEGIKKDFENLTDYLVKKSDEIKSLPFPGKETELINKIKSLSDDARKLYFINERIMTLMNKEKINDIVDKYIDIKELTDTEQLEGQFFNLLPNTINLSFPKLDLDFEKTNIKIDNLNLDNDPEINLKFTGGDGLLNVHDLISRLGKKDSTELESELQEKINQLNRLIKLFNITFIQYSYYMLFVIRKTEKLSNLGGKIFFRLNGKQINEYRNKLVKLYYVINNPKGIFSGSQNKLKKTLYFKHYFIINILFNFFDRIVKKFGKSLQSEKNVIELLDKQILEDTDNNEIEKYKYFKLFNLYYDIVEKTIDIK